MRAMITAQRLLHSIDGLAYGARQRLLAEHARELAGSAELTTLLDDLHAHGDFARRIAVRMAAIAGERGYVERCLTAAETGVVGRALGSAVRLGLPGAVLAGRLPELPPALRHGLYQEVRQRRATELAEALLPAARAFGAREAAVLLPACTADTVAATLPEVGYAITGWRMVGHRHPGVFLDYLDAELSATPRSGWARLLDTVGSGITAAALSEPARVLDVLERTVPYAPLPLALGRVMGALARHDAARLLGVLLHPRRDGFLPGGRKLWRALLGADDAELAALGRALSGLQRFLRVLPPSRRAAVYAGAVGGRDLATTGTPIEVLDQLPAAARGAEARRLLGLRSVADDPFVRLAVTARLPWAEARDTLRDATRRSTADERAEAYPCYIGAAAASRDPEVFAELLGTLTRLANEQDPVRHTALGALAEVPPWLFRSTEAATVLRLMTDAAQARDCSWQTEHAVRTLAARLIREGTLSRQPELVDTGLRGLGLLGQHVPSVNLSALDHDLPRGGEHQVFEALRTRLDDDARRGEFGMALALAAGLRRRAWGMPELQEIVGQATKATDDHVVHTAIGLWLGPPATKDERLAEVFHADRSTITIPAVLNGIAWRRTDLLDEVLGKSLHGRFLKKKQRHVLSFDGGFDRWLPRQANAYAELLVTLAGAKRVSSWERAGAVRRLGSVPGATDHLRAFLSHRDITVVEAALAALAWTSEPAEVMPELLAHADGDRARVAVHAASRCARFVSPDRLAAALAPALTSKKVTSRKEAVRLLAAHRAAGAAETLVRTWAAPDQHRDVRRAVVTAAFSLLDDERVWALLTEAAADQAVATALLDLDPHTIADRHRPRYAELIHAVAGSTDPDIARLGLTALADWTRWDEAGTELLVDRVTDLENTAGWRPALRALVAGCAGTENPDPLRTVATRLAAAAEPTGADRDLPVRQRILALADAVRTGAESSPALRHAAVILADALDSPTLRRPAVELAVAAVPLDQEGDVRALLRVAELADSPIWAWHAHHALRAALDNRVRRLPQPYLHEAATTLAAHPAAPAAQLLAVAIASCAGPEGGWPPHWRELVADLRHHPDPDARLAALDTFMAVE